MAIVPIEIIGQLKTKNYQPLSNFTLYVVENGFNIHRHQNNNVTTAGGLAAFKSLLESYITDDSNHIDGVIISSSVTIDTNQGHIDVNILGEGDNTCDHFAGAFFTEETWSERNNHTIALRFLGEVCEPTLCEDCQDLILNYCNGNPEFDLGLPDDNYMVTIEDHSSNNWYTQMITSTGGVITWDVSSNGAIFNPFTYYTMSILDGEGDVVTWVNGGNQYNCVRFTFKNSTDTTPAT